MENAGAANELSRLVQERIAVEISAGRVPQVVLDLDGTLFDNVPRSKRILLDAARHLLGADHPMVATIEGIATADFEYNPLETLRKLGVADEPTLESLRQEWATRFFGSAYLEHDVPLRGAVDASRQWWQAGAELNYVTGRHVPEMFLGTCRSLHEAGFPIGTVRTQLLMKPAYDLNDVAFKIETVPSIRNKGPISLIVDNDPRVLNALCSVVPEAMAVMVRTLYPRDSPEPIGAILRVEDFRGFLVPIPDATTGAPS